MDFINRHAESTINRLAASYPAVLVTGARQTGKTTLLKRVSERKPVPYLTFDDPMEESSAKADSGAFPQLHPAHFVSDEVQYVPDLFRCLKAEIDRNRSNGRFGEIPLQRALFLQRILSWKEMQPSQAVRILCRTPGVGFSLEDIPRL